MKLINHFCLIITFFYPILCFGQEKLILDELLIEESTSLTESSTGYKEEIDLTKNNTDSLTSALKKSSSTVVQQQGSQGSLVSVKVPGSIQSNQTLILIDDIPVNSGRGFQFDLSHLPKNWFESAEVLQGTYGHIYGAYSAGGVVNLKTKEQKEDREAVGFAGGNSEFSAKEGGSIRWRFNNNIGAQLSAELNQAPEILKENSSFAGIYELGGINFENKSFLTSFKQFLLLSDKIIPPNPAYNFVGNQKTSQHLSIAKFSYKNLHTSIAHQLSNTDFSSSIEKTKTFNNSLFVVSKTSLPLASWSRLNLRGDATSNWLTGISPGTTNENSIGSSISHDFILFDERLILSTGGRVDWFNNLNFEENYGAGIKYALSKKFSLFGNYGTSFTPPNYAQLFGFPGYNVGNPNLKPSHTRGIDLGLTSTLNKFSGTTRLFTLWHDDLIIEQKTTGGERAFQNGDNSFAYGMSRSFSWEIFPWVQTSWDFTSLFHTFKNKEKVPFTPKYHSTVSLKFPFEKWALTTAYLFRGRMHDSFSNNAPLRSNHDVGVSLLLTPTKNFELELNGSNLLDLEREDMKNYPLPGRTFGALLRVIL